MPARSNYNLAVKINKCVCALDVIERFMAIAGSALRPEGYPYFRENRRESVSTASFVKSFATCG